MHKLRRAVAADAPAIRLLEKELINHERDIIPIIKEGDDVYYKNIPALIADVENTVVMVAEEDGKIIGCGMGQIRQNEHYYKNRYFGYVGMMSVSKAYRGRGLAGEIIQSLISWFKQKGVSEAQLKVFSNNDNAIKAYKKLGFESYSIDMRVEI